MEKIKKLWEVAGKTIPEPYLRNVQMVYTPQLDEGVKDISLLIATLYPVNGKNELHTHDVDEMMIFTSGRGEALVDGKWHLLEPGTVLYIPAGDEHQCVNYSDDAMRIICVYIPSLSDEAVKKITEGTNVRCEKII